MTLTDGLRQLEDPSLTRDERALIRCRLAAEYIHAGRYEAAKGVLGSLWQGIGERPDLRGLFAPAAAEVLLRCGVLSGWLSSVQQTEGAQGKAQDLLTEAGRMFKSQGRHAKGSEVQYELSMCYWRLGAYDEARVVLKEALRGLDEGERELQAKILIRRTLVEIWENRYYEAWSILKEAQPIFESTSDVIKGKWHGQMGLVLIRLSTVEGNGDYADRAIVEFTAAIYHYERAKHERYCATNLNNLAMLLNMVGRYEEAHEPLDRAQRIFARLRDAGNLAQVKETRARVFVSEGKYGEAEGVIAEVIRTFEKGGENALLADALVVQGIVWARLGAHDSSMRALRRSMKIAQESGALTNAGLAALTLIEEHGATRLSESELYRAYRRADNLLKDTQDIGDVRRLRAAARLVADRLSGAHPGKDFSLPKAVLAYEAKFVREALEAEQGSVSRAAKRLGIKHQSLAHMLRTRHKSLLGKRTPPSPRPRSIIKKIE
ncbi:MAG TPA: hypothetical protein VGX48_27860 [Pyrinomonadaceae bacterium]|jgi:tetratricopeptide (TPR) repeat protein|nr:hypothetical protein [Pyrinomonadaceae bacterium]